MKYFDVLADKSVMIAQQVTDRGQSLTAHGYEPLVQLNNQALGDLSLRGFGLGCGFAESPLYNAISDTVVSDLGSVLQRVTNVAFNDALPMIKTVLEKLKQVVNPDIPVAYTTCDIQEVRFDGIWNSGFMNEVVSLGRNVEGNKVSLAGMFREGDPVFEDLASLLKVGALSINDDIAQIVSKVSDTDLRALFSYVFVSGWLPNERPLELILGRDDLCNIVQRDVWVLLFIWARNLASVAPKESAYDLGRYQMNLVALEEMAARVLAGIDEMRQAQSEGEVLVLGIFGTTAVVNGDLYASFLQGNGPADEVGRGSPEIVLGAIISAGGRTQFTKSQLEAEKANFEAAWNNHVKSTSLRHDQTMNSTARRQMYLILEAVAQERLLGQLEGFSQGEIEARRIELNRSLDLIATKVQELPTDFTRDTHRWVFDIVSEVFYPDSDVGLLLGNLREVGDHKDAGLTPDDVRYLATINFVADWLAGVSVIASSGYSPAQLGRNSMALENIDWKLVAGGVGAAVLIALVGYAIYRMVSKTGKGVDRVENELKALDKTLEQVAELKGKVPARTFIENDQIKGKLIRIPKAYLEVLAKSGDVSSVHADLIDASAKFVEGTNEAMKVITELASVVGSSDSLENRARKALALKKSTLESTHRALKGVFVAVMGSGDPATVPEDKVPEVIEAMTAKLAAMNSGDQGTDVEKNATLVDVLFDTSRDIDLDHILAGVKKVKNNLKGYVVAAKSMKRLEKSMQQDIDKAGKDMDAFEKQIKAELPELAAEFDAADAADSTPAALVNFLMGLGSSIPAVAIANVRFVALTCFAASKSKPAAE